MKFKFKIHVMIVDLNSNSINLGSFEMCYQSIKLLGVLGTQVLVTSPL